MKAALFEKPYTIQIVEKATPKPEPGWVLIKTLRAGICGSDLHNYRGCALRNNFEAWQQLGFAEGHELCGEVVAVGDKVEKVKIGDRVTAEAVWHCGSCYMCKSGQYHLCLDRKDLVWWGDGAFAEFVCLPEKVLYVLPESMTSSEGALVEPLAAAYHAVRKAGDCFGKKVLIIGGGSMGQLCAGVAKLSGTISLSILVRYDHQAKVAYEMGCDSVFYPHASLDSSLQFDVVIETTGNSEAFENATRLCRKGGRIVLLGGYPHPQNINLAPIVSKELQIAGSLCYGWDGIRKEFEIAIDLLAKKKINVTAVVTHEFPFDQISEAFRVASDKKSGSIKVHINFNL
ncbi:MAG: hypothetical protein D6813_04890 [Calditrichaeota bacterium]|nr:MAG: hypothetical protein D6813_04890 [Calditrichota bacterium]